MHPSHTIAAAALLAASSVASAAALTERQAGGGPCRGLHVFLVKGNNEPYPGRQGKLAGAICSGVESCDYEDIQFYNPLESPYCDSVTEGAANGLKQIRAYNERCPDSKLVVSGYSQGAAIVGDILGGGGGTFFQECQQPSNEGLGANTPAGKKIVAALVFGDTRHTAGQSYNYLDGSGKDGLFPRSPTQLAELATFAPVLRSYCRMTDPICAGGDVVDDHLNYFEIYTDSAGAWVREMADKADDDTTTTSTVVSSTSTTAIATFTKAASTKTFTSTKTEAAPSSSEEASSVEPSTSAAAPTTETSATAATTESGSPSSAAGIPPSPTNGADADSGSSGSSTSEESPAESTDAGSAASGHFSNLALAAVAFVGILAI
ncbi:Alpha/Beta hydrolase protein [Plectosphaerella plurivora]|uniref:Cutinase n=1 Tax=Plectosphaerella plurivora TaxID=936078 RepID=A0A9P8V174_9PEZI|nr:Alpha/Beta hydrolase protein [Plectosphaerella plurivora]